MSRAGHAAGHAVFVAALPAATRKTLTAKADGPAALRLALHGGAVAGLGALIAAGVPGWGWLLLPQGVLLVFLFTAMHECLHRTAFATARLNDRIAAALGFLLLLPPEWFRLFHFAHHRHTQDPARDPELASPKPETWPSFVWHLTGLPLWASLVRTLLTNAVGRNADPFVPAAARPQLAREARAMLAGYAALAALSVAAGSAVLLWAWVVPALLGQPVLRLYLLAEHGRCPQVADMFENSRTTVTARAVRWLAWNMPYHAEHHAMPAVPFHRLPELHALAEDALKTTERGYAGFAARYAGGLGR
ncbi:MAG: fatty acid desaturase [Rhodobacteraceae bacterium]|nr:fatty acid desaturase [Paracoccaceae bacterium]